MAFNADYLHLAKEYGGPLGCKSWIYDTEDATGVVDGTDYFAGMGAGASEHRGMEVGDLVLRRTWSTLPTTLALKNATAPSDAGWHMVIAVDSDGNATVAAETAIVVAGGS